MVPDRSLSIRERAIAAWPVAWQGQNQRDILVSLGYDIDTPWRELPKKDRDWILFTDEQPIVPVYAGFEADEVRRARKRKEEPSYMGTFTGARRYVLHTFATTQSAMMKKRVARYMLSAECPVCHGKRLRPESLSVKFAGLDITEISRLPLAKLAATLRPYADGANKGSAKRTKEHPEQVIVAQRITEDIEARLAVLLDLGLGYLSLERSTPTLSPGELQRLRLATQVRSNLFGVVYVLDEPSAGLHPVDTQALLTALDRLKASGNSLFVVEHDLDVIRHADWIVDVGPGAGEHGGLVLYSGPPAGLEAIEASKTRRHLFRSDPRAASIAALTQGLADSRGRDPQQSPRSRCRISARRLHDGDRRVGIGQVEPGQPGAGRSRRGSISVTRSKTMRRRRTNWICHRPRPRAAASPAAWMRSPGWWSWIRSRSAARRDRISRPTRGCSITCASCSPQPRRHARASTTPGAFPSTSPRDDARRAREKAS